MKRTFSVVTTLTLAGLVVASCSPLNKMKKRAGELKYNVTPEVLEEKGEMVDVKIHKEVYLCKKLFFRFHKELPYCFPERFPPEGFLIQKLFLLPGISIPEWPQL